MNTRNCCRSIHKHHRSPFQSKPSTISSRLTFRSTLIFSSDLRLDKTAEPFDISLVVLGNFGIKINEIKSQICTFRSQSMLDTLSLNLFLKKLNTWSLITGNFRWMLMQFKRYIGHSIIHCLVGAEILRRSLFSNAAKSSQNLLARYPSFEEYIQDWQGHCLVY